MSALPVPRRNWRETLLHAWDHVWLALRLPLPRYLMEVQMKSPRLRGVRLRQYRESDFEACRMLCDLNAPGRFPRGTAEAQIEYLQTVPERNLVAEVDGQVIGCGGYLLNHPNHAILVFGLVHPAYQKMGVGRLLFFARIVQMPLIRTDTIIQIATVKAALPYYRQFGFEPQPTFWEDEEKGKHPLALMAVNAEGIRRVKHYLKLAQVPYPDLSELPPEKPMLLE
ncbi:GNAT family N-acetyltransferase [Prosthecobacter algae]|uniref:GNAT family N-acetyltransferase n=1 Tax=Prosthecobacter algae TaxID=1144682 RepID=UPI0031E8CC57